jgi:hypothetical protein
MSASAIFHSLRTAARRQNDRSETYPSIGRKPLPDRLRCGPEATSFDHFTALVESAVMAPDIIEVDADRQLHPGLSAWDFRDEVLRWLLHGKQSLPSGGPAHPIYWYSD